VYINKDCCVTCLKGLLHSYTIVPSTRGCLVSRLTVKIYKKSICLRTRRGVILLLFCFTEILRSFSEIDLDDANVKMNCIRVVYQCCQPEVHFLSCSFSNILEVLSPSPSLPQGCRRRLAGLLVKGSGVAPGKFSC
jgi:hypothetical protein